MQSDTPPAMAFVSAWAHVDIGDLYRREYGRILATLIRKVRDIGLAEDSLQEAFAEALARWPAQGIPPSPVPWLMATARNRAIDHIRRRAFAETKKLEILNSIPSEGDEPVPQDLLRLIFTCCHPALAPEAQIALTLHTVCGLTTEEIARAFLVPVPTLAQRLVRAKTKIRHNAIPYEIPEEDRLSDRVETVLTVVYLVFNEGYSAGSGPALIRADLCAEAIRLGRQLVALLPEDREAKGLLALMILNHARGLARIDNGQIVLLEDQDRSLWDRALIEEGTALARSASLGSTVGSYGIQAAITALHANAPSWEETDWTEIALLYGLLARVYPSPVVELNRAVAVGMASGLELGLSLMEKIVLPEYHLLPAARAEFLRRLGRYGEAATAYREALQLVRNDPERHYLERRLAEVSLSQSES